MTRTEIACRALCFTRGINPDAGIRPNGDEQRWMEFLNEAVLFRREEDRLVALHGVTSEPVPVESGSTVRRAA